MEVVETAEVVEGVVDNTWVEEPNAKAEAELAQVVDMDTDAEPDADMDLEARLANFEGLNRWKGLIWMQNP